MKIKNDPMFEIACGITPNSLPESEEIYVVYMGLEDEHAGTIQRALGGIGYVTDSGNVKQQACRTRIISAYETESDAQNAVDLLNAKISSDAIQYKYRGIILMPHPEIPTKQIADVAIVYRDAECFIPDHAVAIGIVTEDTVKDRVNKKTENSRSFSYLTQIVPFETEMDLTAVC